MIWQRADGAKKYVVYAGACGKKNALKKVKTTTSRSYTMKKWNGKKLQKGKYYKIMVAALDENNKVISVSKLVHAATKGGKTGNAKSVSTTSKADRKVKKLTFKVGETIKLKAKAAAESAAACDHRSIVILMRSFRVRLPTSVSFAFPRWRMTSSAPSLTTMSVRVACR